MVCGVHTPDDARIVRFAAQVAQRISLRLQLVHVSTPEDLPSDRLFAAIEDIARIQLRGDDFDVFVETGEPEERLSLLSRDAELLVVGSSGANAVSEALRGSVTATVTRTAAAPVVVVPRDDVPDGVRGGVVCGVRDRRDVACASAAARVAAALGAPLVLVHVVMPVVAGVAGPAVTPLAEVAAVEAAQELLDEVSAALAARLPVLPVTRVLSGPPGPELARAVAESQAAFLAVGASERRPLAAAIVGTASRYATHHAGCPVLVCPRGEHL